MTDSLREIYFQSIYLEYIKNSFNSIIRKDTHPHLITDKGAGHSSPLGPAFQMLRQEAHVSLEFNTGLDKTKRFLSY